MLDAGQRSKSKESKKSLCMRLHTHIAELSLPKENNRCTRACAENDFTHARNKTKKKNESQAQASSIAALALDWVGISGVSLGGEGAEYARRLNRCVELRGRSFSVSSLEGMIKDEIAIGKVSPRRICGCIRQGGHHLGLGRGYFELGQEKREWKCPKNQDTGALGHTVETRGSAGAQGENILHSASVRKNTHIQRRTTSRNMSNHNPHSVSGIQPRPGTMRHSHEKRRTRSAIMT